LPDEVATKTQSIAEICAGAKNASRVLAQADSKTKNAALELIALGLEDQIEEILAENALDVEACAEAGAEGAILDRLKLSEERVAEMARGARDIRALPDPVGETMDGWRLENGMDLRKVRVPLGVVAVVYEARPNVTIDCSCLCVKSGNAIVLQGSQTASRTNSILSSIAQRAAHAAGLPEQAVSVVDAGREHLRELSQQKGLVDLLVPRGGEGLKETLERFATVPVLYAAAGNCHIYVDSSADLEDALAIALNAKLQRPGVCNAVETLLVHSDVAPQFLPACFERLVESGVELRVDERGLAMVGGSYEATSLADDSDWSTEFLSLKLAVRIVDSVDDAVEHINSYGTGHSEAIITQSTQSARRFTQVVDAACVYVNASTRFTDGGEFGMGAEIGNSTQKLHARGPIGMRELCTFKFLIEGSGQVR
jgi:glutamate-5-semialdehyde dehydrogenase